MSTSGFEDLVSGAAAETTVGDYPSHYAHIVVYSAASNVVIFFAIFSIRLCSN